MVMLNILLRSISWIVASDSVYIAGGVTVSK